MMLEKYMARCLQLAEQASGYTAPNPLVGALLLYEDTVIGEGFHKNYGGPHAEVECINSVSLANRHLISQSTLLVSLEPCDHFGKTPPCTDLIIQHKIPRVVVGCMDVSARVNGKGIRHLQEAGVEVTTGILEKEARFLNRRFFTFHQKQRPYIVLKWAQTAGGIMGVEGQRLKISNPITDRLVHQWRSEEAAILVGSGTALADDPLLTTRLWPGKNPVRIVWDSELRLSSGLKLFNTEAPIWVFNKKRNEVAGHITYIQYEKDTEALHFLLDQLHQRQILSLLVEGGAFTLNSFLSAGLWDEARVITNHSMGLEKGIAAPIMNEQTPERSDSFRDDTIRYYFQSL